MEDSFAMNGGDGPTSYTHNSKLQGMMNDLAKVLLTSSVQKHLVLPIDARVFRIADLGCSVGPNTFSCVENIVGSVVSKYKAKDLASKTPEFEVFFNDQVSNDFNILFRNLPRGRPYAAAGVPGSFHGRLFPKSSMDVFYSAMAIQYLSGVPDEVKSPNSPAWNKGRVTYAESAPEVAEAYKAKFRRDITAFFAARSVEIADNGLLAILTLCRSEETVASSSIILKILECLGHALTDMAKEGLLEEALVDSFNFPIFIPTASELKEVISEIEGLSIAVVEEIHYPLRLSTSHDIDTNCLHIRAVSEGLLINHFKSAKIIDTLFQRLPEKIDKFSKSPSFTDTEKPKNLFLLVKKVPVSTRST